MSNNTKQTKCEHCNGKGYNTVLYGIEGSDDFGGEGFKENPTIHKEACKTCEGKGFISPISQIVKIPETMEERFDLIWGLSPKGSLKHKKGETVKTFISSELSSLLKDIVGKKITLEDGFIAEQVVVYIKDIIAVAKEYGVEI